MSLIRISGLYHIFVLDIKFYRVMAYFKRHIDEQLREWKEAPRRKPLLIRGARQVGKSTAVRELGKTFEYFVEINLEKQPLLRELLPDNIDVIYLRPTS